MANVDPGSRRGRSAALKIALMVSRVGGVGSVVAYELAAAVSTACWLMPVMSNPVI